MTFSDAFSEREKEVAGLLLQGKSNKQIAQELGVTTRTVEFHITHIYEKLDVRSRAEAILRLSEPRLRESTAAEGGQPAAVLRRATVEKAPDPTENGENLNHVLRRITMKKLLVSSITLAALSCLVIGLAWLSGRAFFMSNPMAQAGDVVVATHTAWVQAVLEPTYTPIQDTPTAMVPSPTAMVPSPTAMVPTPTAMVPSPTPWVSPTEAVITDITVQELGENRYRFEGVEFGLDPALGAGALGVVVLENPSEPNSPYWEAHPQYLRLTLKDYPLAGTFWKPVIAVYPVEDYRRISPLAAETIDQLQARLREKPEDPGVGVEANIIPFLPLINAGQGFHSNVEYLDFQNGSGVRFLALYGQYPAPVNNQELFYTYQGLTTDGRHLISIILPVSHPSLPANADAVGSPTLQAIAGDYATYRAQTANALHAQAENSFTPDLAMLDALVASVKIDR